MEPMPRPASASRPATSTNSMNPLIHSLSTRTLAIIGLITLAMILLTTIPLRAYILDGYRIIEANETVEDTGRVLNTLNDAIDDLARTSRDYAIWSDTYTYAQAPDAAFTDTNLDTPTLINNDVGLIVILDTNGTVIFSTAADLNTATTRPSMPLINEVLLSPPLVDLNRDDPLVQGLLLQPDHLLLVASHHILRSDGSGPPAGTLIMAREVDPALVEQIATTTRQSIAIYPYDPATLPAEVNALRDQLIAVPLRAVPIDDQQIAGYGLVYDIHGNPAAVVRTILPRTTYRFGMENAAYLQRSLLITGITFGMIIMLLLRLAVLRRLEQTSHQMARIGAEGDLAARLPEHGADELNTLIRDINHMLADLEHAQAERRVSDQERARLQEELIRAREQLFQMSIHDLKTPLTAIIGFVDMLHMTPLDDMQREIANGIRQSSSNLHSLVRDMLDTARLEEGRLQPIFTPTHVRDLLTGSVRQVEQWAARDEKEITIDVDHNPPIADLDVELMQRVIVNLLANAIRHTPPGTHITVGTRIDDSNLVIWVWDNGPGIPAERQQSLFERFQSNPDTATRPQSSGLGLTFCKLAVEAHGGTLTLNSSALDGTTFTIRMPHTNTTHPSPRIILNQSV